MKLISGHTGTRITDATPREITHRAIARRCAAEGMVLLENHGALPLRSGAPAALYGAGAMHPVMGGTGSGSVRSRPAVSILEGLRAAGIPVSNEDWLKSYEAAYEKAYEAWKQSIYDMSIPGDFQSFYSAHATHPMQAPEADPISAPPGTDTAIYVISRVAGEGADRHPAAGDYYLSEIEERQLLQIRAAFSRVILVLNIGSVLDLGFLDRCPVEALVLMGQPGMEAGNALADVLTGRVNPSGRLSETWAAHYADYPCADSFSHMNGNLIEEKYEEGIYIGYRWFDTFEIRPRYPFGYGLSYTAFEQRCEGISLSPDGIQVLIQVKNTGSAAGRDVVFLFASCPPGIRWKERKRLLAFGKTPLLAPGETAELRLRADYPSLASYHGGKSSWFLDAGTYHLLLARDAAQFQPAGMLTLNSPVWSGRQHRICPLQDALTELQPGPEAAERWEKELSDLFSAPCPVIPMDREAGAAMASYGKLFPQPKPDDPLLPVLSLEEKARLCIGEPSRSHISFIGDAGLHLPGSAGETTNALKKYGISESVLADGPAGLRLERRYQVNPDTDQVYRPNRYQMLENRFFGTEQLHDGAENYYQYATAIPVGTMLAQTFDVDLVDEIGALVGREMQEFGVTWWLAPGMNMKRNPLCGRNFEYYSEDPRHAGLIAAALTRGVQGIPGAAVTIKHFACNNQEDNRRGVSAVLSERTLREIYLKAFEIVVREAQPHAIMTSYNRLNGVHTANSRDLCTAAAREEWGFRGIIMTDWTTTNSAGGSSAAGCIAAGNDLIMPGKDSDLREILDAIRETGEQSLPEAELDACCGRILRLLRQLC